MVCEDANVSGDARICGVLILVLMEYGLRAPETVKAQLDKYVLILVLMEYGLRAQSLGLCRRKR